jgi:hypothetical protein
MPRRARAKTMGRVPPRGEIMGSQTNGHSGLLDPKHPPVRVSESGDALLVRKKAPGGVIELSVPLAATCRPKRDRRHIPGCNPDATPC